MTSFLERLPGLAFVRSGNVNTNDGKVYNVGNNLGPYGADLSGDSPLNGESLRSRRGGLFCAHPQSAS